MCPRTSLQLGYSSTLTICAAQFCFSLSSALQIVRLTISLIVKTCSAPPPWSHCMYCTQRTYRTTHHTTRTIRNAHHVHACAAHTHVRQRATFSSLANCQRGRVGGGVGGDLQIWAQSLATPDASLQIVKNLQNVKLQIVNCQKC